VYIPNSKHGKRIYQGARARASVAPVGTRERWARVCGGQWRSRIFLCLIFINSRFEIKRARKQTWDARCLRNFSRAIAAIEEGERGLPN